MAFVKRDMVPGIEFVYGSLTASESPLVVGILGSTAYGLATEHSDVDYLGVHYVATDKLYGLGVKDLLETTRVGFLPDYSSHEIFKFVRLALGGNPTILEVLFLDKYEYISPEFEKFREIRHAFLSTKKVKAAYTGYVLHQAKRLVNRNGRGFDPDLAKRTQKHARHCCRLLMQAEAALLIGEIVIDVSQARDEIFEIGEMAETNEEKFLEFVQDRVEKIDNLDSVLADKPDRELIEKCLIEFRMEH